MLKVDLKLGTYQCANIRRDLTAALQNLNEVVSEAVEASLDLVLFPELYLCGYDISVPDLKRFAVSLESDEIKYISNLAAVKCIAIAVGYAEKYGEKVYNSCCLFDSNGQLVLNYRKTHLWDPSEVYEKVVFTPGSSLPVGDLFIPRTMATVRVGILICFDCEFPEPARTLTLKGAAVILIPTALAADLDGDIAPHISVPSRAGDNEVFIVYSNFSGPCVLDASGEGNTNMSFCGQSAIIGPDGRDVVRADKESTGLFRAHIQGAKHAHHVRRNDYLHERRPALYTNVSAGSNGPLIAYLADIKAAIPSVSDLLLAAANGFKTLSSNSAVAAPVQHLTFPQGTTCVKSGYTLPTSECQSASNTDIHESTESYFVTKIASSHPGNTALGLDTSSGVMLLFAQATGKLRGILLDDGYLTDLRTAIASALAIQQFGPREIARIGIVGTGTQARIQLNVLKSISTCRVVTLWGRDQDKLCALQKEAENMGYTTVETTMNMADVCGACNVIITVTSSTTPLITADQVKSGTMIVALGADGHGKQELDPDVLHPSCADLVLVDSKVQCCAFGEVSHAIQAGVISSDNCVEIGFALLDMGGEGEGRRYIRAGDERPADGQKYTVVFDSTGVAVQDVQIAEAVYKSLKRATECV